MQKSFFKIVLIICFVISVAISPLFAENNSSNKWSNFLTQEDAINLLNYIQLSVSKVINARSKGMLEEEFSAIINNINSAALQDSHIIRGYENLLGTLTRLKLSEMEKAHIREVANMQRKQAFTNIFNSFGSIMVSVNPVQLAYVALNSSLNYARAVMDANATEIEAEYQIEKQDLETIEQQRSSLFVTSANVFQGKTNTAIGLITEEEMKDFAAIATIIELKDVTEVRKCIPTLNAKISSFKTFAPFWLVLGNAYMKINEYDKALQSYKTFEELMIHDDHLFSNNIYYLEVAKNIISILMQQGSKDYETILYYTTIIINNTPKATERIDDMNYFLASVYSYCEEMEKAKETINYLVDRGLEKKPQKGLLSTYVYALGNGKSSSESNTFIKLFDGVRFGYNAKIKDFINNNNIKVDNKILFISEFEVNSVSFVNSKGKVKNEIFRSYRYNNQTLYCLDNIKWADVLSDGSYLKLECVINGTKMSAKYIFSEEPKTNYEFSTSISIKSTVGTDFFKSVFGGYSEIYQHLESI